MTADHRLPLDPIGLIAGHDGIVEGRHGANVRPQPTIPHPLDDFTQLRAIGFGDEINCRAVRRLDLSRA
jgi:hypothetical protein